jgi:hypothetical protein
MAHQADPRPENTKASFRIRGGAGAAPARARDTKDASLRRASSGERATAAQRCR